jgi:thiamine biosynthesis lipoprotein
MLRREFAAMGTTVEILLQAPQRPASAGALAAVEAEFARLEAVFSRFRPDSELSRLNEGGSIRASEDLLTVAEMALAARDRSGGRFDPTVHDAVAAAGYARSLRDGPLPATAGRTPGPCGGRVVVDRVRRRIELGPGVRLDLGGIAKGYAADRACDLLVAAGPCLVNAGGDLAVRGVPRAGVWSVGVETPRGPLALGLRRGALATSGRDRRRWRLGGRERHHVIDPATGEPAATDLLRATVAAETAAEAEVLATALLVAGADRARREAEALGLTAVLVGEDGTTIRTGGAA